MRLALLVTKKIDLASQINFTFILTFLARASIIVSMNRMDTARRAQVVRCLIEGNSINSTVRMTGVAKNTVLKLLVEIGAACSDYLDRTMRNLT